MTSKLNQIGLDKQASSDLADKLNELLANYQIFYMNARGFHWNIKGEKFFELHAKFEELYNDSLVKIDEIAERILTLGFTPLHTYGDYTTLSKIKAAKNISSGPVAVQVILDGYEVLLPLERELLEIVKKDKIIQKYLNNKDIKNIIFVKNRLINILLNE